MEAAASSTITKACRPSRSSGAEKRAAAWVSTARIQPEIEQASAELQRKPEPKSGFKGLCRGARSDEQRLPTR